MTKYEKVDIEFHKKFAIQINETRLAVLAAIPLYPKQSNPARSLNRLLNSIDQCKCVMDDAVWYENPCMGIKATEMYYPSPT